MEDAAKAIELAVGVIIFIVALTIGLLLYNKLADTANNALTINDTQNSVTYNKNDLPKDFGYIYNSEDIYYLIKDIKSDNELYSEVNRIYVGEGNYTNEEGISYTPKTKVSINENQFNGSNEKYKLKYEYEYIEKDILTELNTHKPKEIYIIKYVE
ncbi:MAG: hypothetical protein E7311_01795 [Clostridiales bacterium]|nr:hypothetical protein [Clostridiales bacterium]